MAQRKSLFRRTEDAASAAQEKAAQGGGNDILALRQAGNRRQARSDSEALGMAFREFILPMILQGAQELKANYDARGDFKATGATLLDRLIGGDQLSQQEQAILDNYQKRYSKEYADAYAAAQKRAQQPAPQGEQPAAPANNPTVSALRDYANTFNGADFWQHPNYTSAILANSDNPADVLQRDVPPLNLTGETLAQEANDNLMQALNQPQNGDSDLFKWISGRW